MKKERKQARKDEERHIVIKEKNEQIIQDMIECIPVLALIVSWTLGPETFMEMNNHTKKKISGNFITKFIIIYFLILRRPD